MTITPQVLARYRRGGDRAVYKSDRTLFIHEQGGGRYRVWDTNVAPAEADDLCKAWGFDKMPLTDPFHAGVRKDDVIRRPIPRDHHGRKRYKTAGAFKRLSGPSMQLSAENQAIIDARITAHTERVAREMARIGGDYLVGGKPNCLKEVVP